MSRIGWTAVVLACAAASCGGTEDPAPEGTVELHFSVGPGAHNSYLVDSLIGTVYGDVYASQDVDDAPTSETGLKPGAVAVTHVRVDGVDVREKNQSSERWNASMPPGKYAFLGFFDLDMNAEDPAYPDKGDPVITPSGALSLAFDVAENAHTEQTIEFDLTVWCPVIAGKLDCGPSQPSP